MSTLIVEVCKVQKVKKHPNADRLDICQVKGWQTIVQKNQFEDGDLCVFIPPDSILPPELANAPDDPICPGRLNVTKYLAALPKDNDGNRPPGGRVKAARLRGESSYGLIMSIDPSKGDNPKWIVGTNVQKIFGITKWEPPVKTKEGDAAKNHPLFIKYIDIEHLANYPDVIQEGEEVVITEKIHGRNLRLGLIKEDEEKYVFMAGSHNVPRKEFTRHKIYSKNSFICWLQAHHLWTVKRKETKSVYWRLFDYKIKSVLNRLFDGESVQSVIVFAELFGHGMQDMQYGMSSSVGLRVFDITVDGKYLDYDEKVNLCSKFDVPMVPELWRGPFSHDEVNKHVSGNTCVCEPSEAGPFKGREGVVVTPVKERIAKDMLATSTHGRVIFKAVSADYLARANATD